MRATPKNAKGHKTTRALLRMSQCLIYYCYKHVSVPNLLLRSECPLRRRVRRCQKALFFFY